MNPTRPGGGGTEGACPNQTRSRRCVAGPRPLFVQTAVSPLVLRRRATQGERCFSGAFPCFLLRHCPSISPAQAVRHYYWTLLLSAYLIRKGETGSDEDARPGALLTVEAVVLILVAGVPSIIGLTVPSCWPWPSLSAPCSSVETSRARPRPDDLTKTA